MRRLSRVFAMALVVVVATSALVGCGSGKSTLSKADFIRKADAICGPLTTRVNGVAKPADNATTAESVAYVKQELAIIEPGLSQLSSLSAAPGDFAVLETNLIAPTKDQVAAAHGLITELDKAAGDATAESAAFDKFSSAADDPNADAHDKALAAYGFVACSKTNTDTAPPSTTTTTTTKPPAPYVAKDSSFSAVFPDTPTRDTSPITAAGLTVTTIIYTSVTADEQVSVAYILFPVTPPAANIQSALDNSIDQGAAGASGTIDSRKRITYLGSPAEDAVITSPGHVIHVRVVIIGRKFYVLQGITYTAEAPHPQYDQLLATFHTI